MQKNHDIKFSGSNFPIVLLMFHNSYLTGIKGSEQLGQKTQELLLEGFRHTLNTHTHTHTSTHALKFNLTRDWSTSEAVRFQNKHHFPWKALCNHFSLTYLLGGILLAKAVAALGGKAVSFLSLRSLRAEPSFQCQNRLETQPSKSGSFESAACFISH